MTTRFYVTLFFSALLFLTIVGCGSFSPCGGDKDAFVQKMYSFADDLKEEQKKGTISDAQWENYDEQFKKLTEECYPQFEKELNSDDQLGVTATVGCYYYTKYGMTAVLKLAQADAAIKKMLLEVDYTVLFNMVKEIINNPDEINKIMGDLEKRYGKK